MWQLPYSAGLTLRQLGLALFLAAVGVSAGTPFVRTLREGGGLRLHVGIANSGWLGWACCMRSPVRPGNLSRLGC